MTRLASLRARRRGSRLLRDRFECAVLGLPATDVHQVRERRIAVGIGCVTVVVTLVAAVFIAIVRPSTDLGNSRLVMVRDSGALFVRIADGWHPVANIASARLILGTAEGPRLVDEFSRSQNLGAPVGIPGAPDELGRPLHDRDVRWFVCAEMDHNTVIGTNLRGGRELADVEAVLVQSIQPEGSPDGARDGATYLLYRGRRAEIDIDDPAVERALRTEGVAVRQVSSTLLNMVPEVPRIAVPRIAGGGQPSQFSEYSVGTVVRVVRASSNELYVVLRHGLQRVTPLTADLLRFADLAGSKQFPVILPELVARSPLVDELSVASFPDLPPAYLDAGAMCVTWSVNGAAIMVEPEPFESRTELATRDSAGPAVDFVATPLGRSIDVRTPLTGVPGSSSRYLLTDKGVRFSIDDAESARALGFDGEPVIAPWPLISALPAGPDLNRQSALAIRDSMGSVISPR